MQDVATETQDSTSKEVTSAAKTEQTSAKTYTEEELQARLNKQSNTIAATGKRHEAEMKALQSQITESQSTIKTLTDQLEQMEENGVKEPDAKDVIKAKRELRQARANLLKDQEALKAERDSLSADKEEIANFKVIMQASEIANKYEGVDFQDLIDMTDGSVEKMETLAAKLGKPKTEEKKPQTTPITAAGGGKVTTEQQRLDERYPSMKKT
jgi:chromosome segregation ATPase